ncbi:unnamed protein product [Blepharisma stoltei]|uniref:Peroxisomal membrane protein 11B n=1 Tax=Blepharisma stoltei TaxID=1481888 RepID=A0AAU9JNR8_9CILI|nr:unnamed protein product [Blepharisma stoltei]
MESAEKYLSLLNQSDFREQCIRLVQYFSLGIKSGLKYTNMNEISKKAGRLNGNLHMVRKVLRFGMPIGVLITLYRRLSNKNLDIIKLAKTLENLVSLVYYFSDHFLFLHKIEIIHMPQESKTVFLVYVLRNLSWVIDNGLIALINAIKVHKGNIQLQKMRDQNLHTQFSQSKDRYRALVRKNEFLQWVMIKSIFDIPIAIYYLDKKKFHPTIIGILGTVTSIIYLLQCWKRKKL